MAFLALAKKWLFSPIFTSPHPRFLSSSSTQNPDPKSSPAFVVVDYLVSTFGFSPARAATVSKHIAHLKSPQKPDAVRSYLQHHGFEEAGIRTIITGFPKVLCCSPQNTIDPNLRALRNMGLSTSALTQIIVSSPQVLQCPSAVLKINFWRDFVGGEEATLVKLCKRNRGLLNLDINRGIATKKSLLQSHGISDHDIQWIICVVPKFIITSVSLMEDSLKRAKELGFQPESKMFAHGLIAMGSTTREALQKKKDLLKSLGWSEDEFLTAVRKAPAMLGLSEKNLRVKMDFLLQEARCDLPYITFHPTLLTYSLEKRLRPRLHVLRLLQSKDLTRKRYNFYSAVQFSNNEFVAKYILPHMEEIPELHEVYLSACASGPDKPF